MLVRRSKARSAGEELIERERLHEVVVGAGVEAGDAIAHLVAGRQHQHGRVVAARAEAPAHFEPVGARHQHVEDDRIGRDVLDLEQRIVAVDRGVHVVALVAKRARDGFAHALVVFYDEEPSAHHGRWSRTCITRLLATDQHLATGGGGTRLGTS